MSRAKHLRLFHVICVVLTLSKLFANSRLGELSDTIGSLRYSSFDGQDIKKYPALDSGLHLDSSSEDTSGILSWASSSSDELEGDEIEKSAYVNKSDSDDPDEETKRQINLRDRLRISRPLFQKGDFLMGDDFSLLSAVDELDAYALIGIELMHLLVNVLDCYTSRPLGLAVDLQIFAEIPLYQYYCHTQDMPKTRPLAVQSNVGCKCPR